MLAHSVGVHPCHDPRDRSGSPPCPHALHRGVVAAVPRGGLSPELTFRAYHAVDSHILGFTLWEIGHTMGLGDIDPDLAGQLMVEVSSGDYPYLLEHADQHMADDDEHEQEGEFEFGLDIVLDGLRRLHETEASPRRRSRR